MSYHCSGIPMKAPHFIFIAWLLSHSNASLAFESDVHFGLTQWLALQAGFDEFAARTIATGDQRVDSGDMQFLDLELMYACLGKDDVGARRAGTHHYPTATSVPAAPEQRSVVPGSEAAKSTAMAASQVQPNQASYMLLKLGEGLHILQDSWSHQGIPEVPQGPGGEAFSCDPMRTWNHSKARGGWNSHKADLTMYWPADSVAMAKATYEILVHYPSLSQTPRVARSWETVLPLLDGFVAASTKEQKRKWFNAHGIEDVSFLEGISLKDGTQPFTLKWSGRKLPPLPSAQSRQHGIDGDLLDFYNRFFLQWIATQNFETLALQFGPDFRTYNARGSAALTGPANRAQLVARLKVWRLRDHGRVADLAHSSGQLTERQIALIEAAAREANGYAKYDDPAAAFFPLLPRGQDVSPLLPFFVSTATTPHGSHPRAIAVAKLRHAPYDTVAAVAEKVDGRWSIVSIVSDVDH